MSTETFRAWFPVLAGAVQIVFLPVVLILLRYWIEKVMQGSPVLDAKIDSGIRRHNDNIYSHPALADLKKLEGNIDRLTTEVTSLGIKIERLTPRRRLNDQEG